MSRGTIQRTIRQTKPFRSASQEAVLGILMVADRLKRSMATATEPEGITQQQYNVLRILRGAGDDGLPTLAIAERMVEHTPGITRLIDRLELKRLVRRERCPEDRRLVRCHITEPGRALIEKLDKPVARIDHHSLGMLSEAERKKLVGLLERILAAPE